MRSLRTHKKGIMSDGGNPVENRRCWARGDEAWRGIKQFDQIQSADLGPSSVAEVRASCADATHAKGEWIGAEIRLQTQLLAQ